MILYAEALCRDYKPANRSIGKKLKYEPTLGI